MGKCAATADVVSGQRIRHKPVKSESAYPGQTQATKRRVADMTRRAGAESLACRRGLADHGSGSKGLVRRDRPYFCVPGWEEGWGKIQGKQKGPTFLHVNP